MPMQSNVKPPSQSKVRAHITAVSNLKPAAMAALVDVTQLKGRAEDHKDLKILDFHRVNMHSLTRNEFKALRERAQEVYIYRLAG